MTGVRYRLHSQSLSSTKPATSVATQPETLTPSKAFLLSGLFFYKRRKHRVIEGDYLEGIAEKYGTTVSALKKLNKLDDDVIYTGPSAEISLFCLYPLLRTTKDLKPPPPELMMIKVKYGDTLVHLSCQHGLSIYELQRLNNLKDDVIIQGDVLVVSAGSEKKEPLELRHGRRRTDRILFSRQFLSKGSSLGVGGPDNLGNAKSISNVLNLEGKWKQKKKGFQQRDKVHFSLPLKEGFLSSPFGWRWGAFHEGVDLAAEQGTPIYASDKGTVTFAGWNGGYGYLVAIQHEGGFVTRYAHCCAIHARVGQKVQKGQQVAAVGSTGRTTGPHLHFEVRRNGEALDPFKWVPL